MTAIVTVTAVVVFEWTIVHALWYAPDTEVSFSRPHMAAMAAADPADYPERFEIPALHINTTIQQVGINSKGNMGVPDNFTDVAWYKYGPAPGQTGSAVIDGHVDNGLGLDGVFKHLSDIQIGDDIFVDTKSGKRLHFVVREIDSYPYKDVAVDRLFNPSDAVRLNLVTCEGVWVKGDKTYDHRLVVYTELVGN